MRRLSKTEAGDQLMKALEVYIIAVVTERMKREMHEERDKFMDQEKYFEGLPFEKVMIGEVSCYKGRDGSFYNIDEGKTFIAIECTDDENEARLGVFEDADLFDKDKPDRVMLALVRLELGKMVGCRGYSLTYLEEELRRAESE